MNAVKRSLEEALYAQVAAEVAAGVKRDGLWAKAIAESGGSADAARALYLRFRVQSLLDEEQLRQTAAAVQQDKAAKAARHVEEQKRKAGVLRLLAWGLAIFGGLMVLAGLAELPRTGAAVLPGILIGAGLSWWALSAIKRK